MWGRVFAILAAPVFLALFFVATTPSEAKINAGLLWAAYLAAVSFWPPALLTNYLGRLFRINSAPQWGALMGTCPFVLTSTFAVVPTLIFSSSYTWRTGLRDALTEAVAAAGGFLLYRTLRGLGHQTSVGAAPTNRWSGP
jgi:hypothetical protein